MKQLKKNVMNTFFVIFFNVFIAFHFFTIS